MFCMCKCLAYSLGAVTSLLLRDFGHDEHFGSLMYESVRQTAVLVRRWSTMGLLNRSHWQYEPQRLPEGQRSISCMAVNFMSSGPPPISLTDATSLNSVPIRSILLTTESMD